MSELIAKARAEFERRFFERVRELADGGIFIDVIYILKELVVGYCTAKTCVIVLRNGLTIEINDKVKAYYEVSARV